MRLYRSHAGIMFSLLLFSCFVAFTVWHLRERGRAIATKEHMVRLAGLFQFYYDQYHQWPVSMSECVHAPCFVTKKLYISNTDLCDGWGRPFEVIRFDFSHGYGAIMSKGAVRQLSLISFGPYECRYDEGSRILLVKEKIVCRLNR